MIGKTYDQLTVGDASEFSKTVSESDVYLYAGITGDLNPAHINETYAGHINESYASNTFFKNRIAHGMLTAGFISAVIGTQLPGPGTIYMSQNLNFLAPVRIGDTVTARVTVIEKLDEKKRVRLETNCYNQDGTQLVSGEALISPPRPAA